MSRTSLTRRATALAAVSLSAVLILTGCGSSNASDSTSPEASSAPGAFPLTVDTVDGPVTIEKQPTRIVAIDDEVFDSLLALGVKPIGASSDLIVNNKDAPWYGDGRLDGITAVSADNLNVSNYEELAALNPDLILAGDKAADEAALARLNEIAPTVREFVGPDQEVWQATLSGVGLITGNEAAAEAILEQVDQLVQDAVDDLPNLRDKTAVYMATWDGNYMAFINGDDSVNRLFSRFGLSVPETLEGQDQDAISMENYQLLDADILFVASSNGERDGVQGATTLDQIPAVQDGRVAYVSPDYGIGLITPTALSLPYLIEDLLVPAFGKL